MRQKSSKIRNEAKLRYCIGDPIVNLLCDLGKYKVRQGDAEGVLYVRGI